MSALAAFRIKESGSLYAWSCTSRREACLHLRPCLCMCALIPGEWPAGAAQGRAHEAAGATAEAAEPRAAWRRVLYRHASAQAATVCADSSEPGAAPKRGHHRHASAQATTSFQASHHDGCLAATCQGRTSGCSSALGKAAAAEDGPESWSQFPGLAKDQHAAGGWWSAGQSERSATGPLAAFGHSPRPAVVFCKHCSG